MNRRCRDTAVHPGAGCDAGQVAGIEVLPLALLVFVVGSLLLANAWVVIDAKVAASAAAHQAASTYAETPAGLSAAASWARAEAAAEAAFTAYQLPAARTHVEAISAPGPRRCARVVVEATVEVPVISLPWIGGFGEGLAVSSRHGRLVDPHRSGLEGGSCA